MCIFSSTNFLSDSKRNLHDASISSMKRLASCSPSISVEDENQQNGTSNISATFLRYSTEVMESVMDFPLNKTRTIMKVNLLNDMECVF